MVEVHPSPGRRFLTGISRLRWEMFSDLVVAEPVAAAVGERY